MARTDALLLSDSLPKNSKALLTLLSMCSDEVQKLVQGSQFGFVYQPTMLGKDIALALENYINEVPGARRAQATAVAERADRRHGERALRPRRRNPSPEKRSARRSCRS